MSRSAAAPAIRRPVATEPVKAILRTSGWSTSGAGVRAVAADDVEHPVGQPGSRASSPSSSVLVEVASAALTTRVLPAASAGAISLAAWFSGAFQGVITPTTPHGSRRVNACGGGPMSMTSPVSARSTPA